MAIPFSSWDGGRGIFDIGCTLFVRLSVRLHTETVQVGTMVRVKRRRGRAYIKHRSNSNEYENSIEISVVEMRTIASQTTGNWNVSSTVCSREQLYEYQSPRINVPLWVETNGI